VSWEDEEITMTKLHVRSERQLPQPADLIYRLIADFEHHHHRFLPPQFGEIKVIKGGYGAGTEHTFTSTLGGTARAFHMVVSEPEPGRVLIEQDTLSLLETTTKVTPEGSGSRIVFETVWQGAGGFTGLLESWFAPGMMRRMYEDEFNRLEHYARQVKG
jgi:Polyketide cyclase / dehydrase and lipid transport